MGTKCKTGKARQAIYDAIKLANDPSHADEVWVTIGKMRYHLVSTNYFDGIDYGYQALVNTKLGPRPCYIGKDCHAWEDERTGLPQFRKWRTFVYDTKRTKILAGILASHPRGHLHS